jgi:hypothetical protein
MTMYVCMYLSMYVCMHVCMRACMINVCATSILACRSDMSVIKKSTTAPRWCYGAARLWVTSHAEVDQSFFLNFRFVSVAWADVQLGDIVKLVNNDPIPVSNLFVVVCYVYMYVCVYFCMYLSRM